MMLEAKKLMVGGLAGAITIAAPVPAHENLPGYSEVPPMTSTGSSFEQEARILRGFPALRSSILGTDEQVDCATFPLPQQISCHAFDAITPIVLYIYFGTSH